MLRLAIATATVAAALSLAPVAHADYTWTVQQICDEYAPGTVAMNVVASTDVTCAQPGSTPGLIMAPPNRIPQIMKEIRVGSYPVDPANTWSDWIIPEGSQPAPPAGPAVITDICDKINGQLVCGPVSMFPDHWLNQ